MSQLPQNATGRLAAATAYPYLSVAGGDVPEMYSYLPGGAVTAKQVQIGRGGTDIDGNFGTGYAALEADYTYNAAGQVATYQIQYPNSGSTSGRIRMANDGMAHASSLSTPFLNPCAENTGHIDACGGAGNYPLYTDSYSTETMSYNMSGQRASLAWSGSLGVTGGLTYTYSGTQNNGQVTGVTDTISGEAIVYQYDALKRLSSANSTPVTGSAPAAWTQTHSYDGNGNMTSGAGLTLGYDEANRLVSSAPVSGGHGVLRIRA